MYDEDRTNLNGCLVFIGIMVIFFIAAYAIGSAIEEVGGFLIILFIVASIIWYHWQKGYKEKEKNKAQKDMQGRASITINQEHEFSETYLFTNTDGSGFIQIDEKRMKIRIGGVSTNHEGITSRIIEINDVIGVSIAEDGKGILGSDLSSTLGGAAVGGLIFGGFGAVVGAMAGQKTKKVSSISLVLSIDDLSCPFLALNFLCSPVNKGSEEHSKALSEAKRWLGMITILISRRDRSKSRNN